MTVPLVCLECLAKWGLEDFQGPEGLLGCLGHLEFQELKVVKELKEMKVQQVHLALQGNQEARAQLVHQ